MEGKSIVSLVVGITIALLVIGYLLPSGFTAYHDDSKSYTSTLTTTGGITTIGQAVSINLTAANADTNATLALYELGALVDTQTINLDAAGTFVAPGGTITVTPTAIGATSATIDVVIPAKFRWGSDESAIFDVVGVLVLIGLLLAIIAFAIKAYE